MDKFLINHFDRAIASSFKSIKYFDELIDVNKHMIIIASYVQVVQCKIIDS